MRDRSIDLSKGLAILFVYLGHSLLYHPIHMEALYDWCWVLGRVIESFNMPMFFIISGYLFSKTHKSTAELYKGKSLRILVPYLTTMIVVIGVKLILPVEMSYNQSVRGGIISLIINWLCYGGDRWFVYTLFIIFLILIPLRNMLKKKWFDIGIIAVLIGAYFLAFLPKIFALDRVFHFMVFFIAGYALDEYYSDIKTWALKYWWLVYTLFAVCNVLFVRSLFDIQLLYLFVLPFTGTLAVMTFAFQLERIVTTNKVVQYVEYCGKYSLQFYLFTFCYPIIRTVIVSVLHVTNPFVILFSVFILQLIAITLIVEITRRIRFLKLPCGY